MDLPLVLWQPKFVFVLLGMYTRRGTAPTMLRGQARTQNFFIGTEGGDNENINNSYLILKILL